MESAIIANDRGCDRATVHAVCRLLACSAAATVKNDPNTTTRPRGRDRRARGGEGFGHAGGQAARRSRPVPCRLARACASQAARRFIREVPRPASARSARAVHPRSPSMSLSRSAANTAACGRAAAARIEPARQRARGLRVVRDVDESRRRVGDALQAPRAARAARCPARSPPAATGSTVAQRLQRGHRRRRHCAAGTAPTSAGCGSVAVRVPSTAPGASPSHRPASSRKSMPARCSRAPMLRRVLAAALAGGSSSPTTAGRPARKMPAFSRPIDSRSGPSHSVWSRSDAGDHGARRHRRC